MNITNISIYAEAYYSGNTHEENILITTESYEKMKEGIDSIKIYISELDGKHSEVEADTSITSFTEEEILNASWNNPYNNYNDSDNDYLKYKLNKIFTQNGLNFDEEYKTVKEYLNSLDTYVDVTIRVKKSNVEKVNKFCEDL